MKGLKKFASALAPLALAFALHGCGGSSGGGPTAPGSGPPVGTVADLSRMVSGAFVAGSVLPTNADTTASLLGTMNVDGLRAAAALFISPTSGLQDAGTVTTRTGLVLPGSETALDKAQLTVSGFVQTVYSTLASHPLGVVLPFDGTSRHKFTVSGSSAVAAFSDSVTSVTLPVVTAPAPAASVSRAADLAVTWSDAGADTTVYCLAAVQSFADSTKFAIGALTLDTAGSCTIPTARLSLLPAGNARLSLARFRLVHHSIAGGRKVDLVSEAATTRSLTLN